MNALSNAIMNTGLVSESEAEGIAGSGAYTINGIGELIPHDQEMFSALRRSYPALVKTLAQKFADRYAPVSSDIDGSKTKNTMLFLQAQGLDPDCLHEPASGDETGLVASMKYLAESGRGRPALV